MTAYYNEFDPFAAEWLRNLMRDGLIAPGDVDTRSIEDVRPDDLRSYTQCHFFAGIGGWSAALRSAGWPDDRRIWTGSCPCQPFSSAGKGAGFDDERHLWPAFHYIIQQCRPSIYVGEQVASKDGYAWLDLVFADVENMGDTLWPVVLPVAGFGAPGERHRIFWLAHTDDAQRRAVPTRGHHGVRTDAGRPQGAGDAQGRSGDERMAHAAPVGRGESGTDGSGFRCRDAQEGLAAGSLPGSASERVGYADGGDMGRYTGAGARSQAPGDSEGREHGVGGERTGPSGPSERVDDSVHPRPQGYTGHVADGREPGRLDTQPHGPVATTGDGARGLAHAGCTHGVRRSEASRPDSNEASEWHQGPVDAEPRGILAGPGPLNGFWRDADWLYCTDAKWRPASPGSSVLADGLPTGMGTLGPGMARLAMVAGCDAGSLKRARQYRVGALKGYGNAINVPVAAEWIRTWMHDV